MNYKIILIDLDDTLLDFQKSEDLAIRKTIEALGIIPTDELVNTYTEVQFDDLDFAKEIHCRLQG